MVARYMQKVANEGLWARRTALFFLQLLLFTIALHRFAGLGTPAAVNLVIVSIIGLFAAIVIAVIGLVRIWSGGHIGAAEAFAALGLAFLGLALPGWYASKAVTLPPLTDVATSPREPLDFKQLAAERPKDANPIRDPDALEIAEQEKAYPDIRPMQLERSADEVYDMVKEAVRRLHWNIAYAEPPSENGMGRIEVPSRSTIMGFPDDVAIGVSGDDTHAQIDVRSVSRYGMHDFGANADHIRDLFAEVKTTLEKGEQTTPDHAEGKAQPKSGDRVKKRKRRPRASRRYRDQAPQGFQPPGRLLPSPF